MEPCVSKETWQHKGSRPALPARPVWGQPTAGGRPQPWPRGLGPRHAPFSPCRSAWRSGMTATPPACTCPGPRPWPWRCKGSALWASRGESGSPFWGRYRRCPVRGPVCPSLTPRPSPPFPSPRRPAGAPGVRPQPPSVWANTSSVWQVHLAMVRYHEAGRFCRKDEAWDRTAALFHLQLAADLGELHAIVGLGLMCLQLPHHILPDVSLQVSGPGPARGVLEARVGRGRGGRGQGQGCGGAPRRGRSRRAGEAPREPTSPQGSREAPPGAWPQRT